MTVGGGVSPLRDTWGRGGEGVDANGISVDEITTLEPGVSVVSVTPSAGSFMATGNNAATGTWSLGSLARGASATLTVTLTVGSSAAPGTNVVHDTSTIFSLLETDTNANNNSASVSTTVARNVDLTVTKSASSASVVAGSGTGVARS